MKQHLLFVYGSLKTGHNRNHYLKYDTYLGKAKTVNKYPLIEETSSFPSLLDRGGWGFHVQGELYEVAPITLSKLDKLEDHPEFFVRKEIAINHQGNIVKAFCYFKSQASDEDFQQFFLEEWTED